MCWLVLRREPHRQPQASSGQTASGDCIEASALSSSAPSPREGCDLEANGKIATRSRSLFAVMRRSYMYIIQSGLHYSADSGDFHPRSCRFCSTSRQRCKVLIRAGQGRCLQTKFLSSQRLSSCPRCT